MKTTILQENLHEALSFVNKAVSTKTQLPVLSNVLLETYEGRLRLSSTNLETSISFSIGATIEKEGAITIPARLLFEIVSSFSPEKILLESEGAVLKLTCGASQASISGIDASEFPPLPQIGEKKDASIQKKLFEKDLGIVAMSASTDEGRPLLTGIKFTTKSTGLVLAATDGYRLSVKEFTSITGLLDTFVVPAKAMQEVAHLAMEEKAEEIDVYFSKDKNQVFFVLPNAQIATRLIEGEFPTYEKIIPSAFTTRIIFIKDELLRAVKLASVYAKESANVIKLEVIGETVIVSANMPQIGENKTTLTVKKEGENGEIAFNSRFLTDILNALDSEEIIFEMGGSLSPGVFKIESDPSFLHIIMPVRVQG